MNDCIVEISLITLGAVGLTAMATYLYWKGIQLQWLEKNQSLNAAITSLQAERSKLIKVANELQHEGEQHAKIIETMNEQLRLSNIQNADLMATLEVFRKADE